MVTDPKQRKNEILLQLTALAAGLGARDPVSLAFEARQKFADHAIDAHSIREIVKWMEARVDREKQAAVEAEDRRMQAIYEDVMRDQY